MTLASILLASSVLAAEPLGPGDYIRSLQHDGRSRSYIVHVPPKYDANSRRRCAGVPRRRQQRSSRWSGSAG